MYTGWGRVESWAVLGPGTDNPWSSWRGGLCERSGPSLYGVAGLSRRNFSKRKSEKKETLSGSLENSPAAAAPDSSPPGCGVLQWRYGGHRAHIRGTKESVHLRGTSDHIQGTRGCAHHRRPRACTHSPEEGMLLNMRDCGEWGVKGCWRPGLEDGGVLVTNGEELS